MQIQYMFLLPARLKVLFNGKTFFFDTPESAWDWVEESPEIRDRNGSRPNTKRTIMARKSVADETTTTY